MNIAEVGFQADTSSLKNAKTDLDNLSTATAKSEKASERAAKSMAKLDAITDRLVAAAAGLEAGTNRLATAMDREANSTAAAIAELGTMVTTSRRAASAADGQAAANDKVAASYRRVKASMDGIGSKAKAIDSVMNSGGYNAARDRGADIAAYGQRLDDLRAKYNPLFAVIRQYKQNIAEIREANRVGAISTDEMTEALKRQRQAALGALGGVRGRDRGNGRGRGGGAGGNGDMYDSMNLGRQLADIGTQLGSGQNPLLILIQQGPQIADIFANAAARGSSFTAVLRAMWTMIAPFVPLILAVVAAIGALAAGFALATREINKSTGDIAKELNLTAKEMKKLKDAGVDTSVTMADTFQALFVTIGESVQDSFGPQLKWLSDAWNITLDAIVAGSVFAFKRIGGNFARFFAYIGVFVRDFPKLFGNAFITAANYGIKALNTLSKAVEGLFGVFGQKLKAFNIPEIVNPFENQGGKTVADAAREGDAAFKAFGEGVDKFGDRWAKNAEKIRKNKITDALGDRDKNGSGKTELERYMDIVAGAKADIAVERTRELAAGIQLTRQQAAALEYETKLLNDAKQKDIKLTTAQTAELKALAVEYGNAKIAADNAVILRDLWKDNDATQQAIRDETALIGLYGRALAEAASKARMISDLRSKGFTDSEINAAMPEINRRAAQTGALEGNNDRQQFLETQRQAYLKNERALRQQAETLGMSADELTRYEYAQRAVNDAIDAHIELMPQDVEQLRAWGLAQAETEIRLRKMAEGIDAAKDTTRGFFEDLRSNIREGKSLWDSLADAAVKAIDKIINRLSDKAIDNLVNILFSGLGNKKSNGIQQVDFNQGQQDTLYAAHGHAFGRNGVIPFAQGGMVDRRTAFAFGNGKRGVMGEAGPEAILPLQRGSNGDLGVRVTDGGGGSRGPVNIVVNNNTTLTGAMSSADIIATTRAQAEKTKQDIKQSLNGWLMTQQDDGTVT